MLLQSSRSLCEFYQDYETSFADYTRISLKMTCRVTNWSLQTSWPSHHNAHHRKISEALNRWPLKIQGQHAEWLLMWVSLRMNQATYLAIRHFLSNTSSSRIYSLSMLLAKTQTQWGKRMAYQRSKFPLGVEWRSLWHTAFRFRILGLYGDYLAGLGFYNGS